MVEADFEGCRLRAHATALRADLIREVEARLLMPKAAATCPKPLNLLVPQPVHPAGTGATGPYKAFASPGGHLRATEDDASVLASCVLTDRGELLVADHTDEGLGAVRPRSLGFLLKCVVVPPSQDLPRRTNTPRRYPVTLLVQRHTSRRRDGLTAGHVDPAEEELRLFATSRSQYDALCKAIDGLNSVQSAKAQQQPAVTSVAGHESEEGGFVSGHVESMRAKIVENEHFASIATLTESQEQKPSPAPVAGPVPNAPESVYAAAEINRLCSADISPKYCYDNYSPDHPPLVDTATAKLQECIGAARKSLLRALLPDQFTQTPPSVHSSHNCLAATAAKTEADIHSIVSAAVAATADLSQSDACNSGAGNLGRDPGSGFESEFDTGERRRRVTEHFELRSAASGLLAGLDAAMVLEISQYITENARLRAILRRRNATIPSGEATEKVTLEPTTMTSGPIILSREPASHNSFDVFSLPFACIFRVITVSPHTSTLILAEFSDFAYSDIS